LNETASVLERPDAAVDRGKSELRRRLIAFIPEALMLKGILVVALALSSISAFARTGELTVRLAFVPQEGVQVNRPDLSADALAQPLAIRIEDGRPGNDPRLIGRGTNDDDETFVIRSSESAVTFLGDKVGQIAVDWGVLLDERADRVLTVSVTRFYVEESNKAVGSMYSAETSLKFVSPTWRAIGLRS
jgi:hypothetical protein